MLTSPGSLHVFTSKLKLKHKLKHKFKLKLKLRPAALPTVLQEAKDKRRQAKKDVHPNQGVE